MSDERRSNSFNSRVYFYLLSYEAFYMKNEFDYINSYYGLNIEKGTRILCTYDNTRGTVVGADGGILKVAQDNGEVGKYSYYHPTWHMVYETTDKLDRIEQGGADD